MSFARARPKRVQKKQEARQQASNKSTPRKWDEMNRAQWREMMRKMQAEGLNLEVVHPQAAGIDIVLQPSDTVFEMIPPHRGVHQDGGPLRRYCRRWRVERLFAWLHHFRRLVIRWEYHVENFFGMVRLGCMQILLRYV